MASAKTPGGRAQLALGNLHAALGEGLHPLLGRLAMLEDGRFQNSLPRPLPRRCSWQAGQVWV